MKFCECGCKLIIVSISCYMSFCKRDFCFSDKRCCESKPIYNYKCPKCHN